MSETVQPTGEPGPAATPAPQACPTHPGPPRDKSRLRRFLRAAVRVALLSYLAAMGLLYLFQSKLVYYPQRAIEATPSSLGMEYQDVSLTTTDGVRLSAWYVPAPRARGTVLFCHGNAGNISHRLDSIYLFHQLRLNVLIFDYRGYGTSEGKPTEEGTYRDAEAAWEYLTSERGVPPGRIVVFGRSLGGPIAARLAGRHPCGVLILESTFPSAPELAAHMLPVFPARWLCRFGYRTDEFVAGADCPVLVVHSEEDDLVPYSQGRAVYEAAGDPREFLTIHGGHNAGFLQSVNDYLDGLDAFLREHLADE